MQLNFNFNGKTLLRNWWGIVKENFQTIQTAFADHLNKFTEHKTSVELDHPDKSVKQKHIADYSIGTQQIEQYTVTGPKIYPAAVQTSHIKDKNVTMPKLSQDLPNIIISVQNGLVWQNDCDLIWQSAGTEIHKVTYNQSSDTGEVEVYVSGRLIVNGAYIYDDCVLKTLTIDYERGESHTTYQTVKLSIELSTGKPKLILQERENISQKGVIPCYFMSFCQGI